jgi:hypothetical protein
MSKYKLASGEVVDTKDYTENQLTYFKYKNPDAGIVEDFQNGAVGTDAPATPVMPSRASIIAGAPPANEPPKKDGDYNFLLGSVESVENRSNGIVAPNSYLIENPEERLVLEEYTNKRGRKVKKYAEPSQEEILRETIDNLDEPEFISNSRGRKVNNPKYVKPENRPSLEVQTQAYIKDNDLDIEFTNNYFNPKGETWFVDKYFGKKELAKAGLTELEMQDFQGMLMRDDFIDGFEEDVADGVYGELGGMIYTGDDKKVIQVTKERTLARKLSQYMADRDDRLNNKMLVNNILENPGDFDQSMSLDEVREEAYKNSNIGYTGYDQEAVKAYLGQNFPALMEKNAKNQEKKNEAYLKRRAWNASTNTADQGVANLGEFIKGLGTGFYKKLDETAIWIDDTIGIFGGNERAKQMRLLNIEDEIADTDSLEYFYASGKGTTIGSDTYIKDERGNIYNTTEGVNVSQILTPLELKSISQTIDAEGKPMDDFSFRGGAIMGGEVTGGIVFDVIGTKGLGTARVAASAGYLSKANKLRSAKGLKDISTRARGAKGRFISTKETFGMKLPFNAQMVDASMYYSFVGAVTGYENTMKAAMQAGLSNEVAEKLADEAQLSMMALYGVTTPINPRIAFVNKLDDILIKNKVFATAVNEYKKTGSQLSFIESIKNQIKQTGLTTTGKGVAFVKEGTKEFIQENVQQFGEVELVNEKINESAGMELMTADYSKDDFINTSILSFAAGGLLGGLSAPGSRVNSNKRLQNLYILSRDLKGTKKRFDRMIDAGRLSQEDADGILEQAKAVGNSSNKFPAWMLKTPDALIEAAVVQSKIEAATNERSQLAPPMRTDVDARLEGLNNELLAIRNKAADELVVKETETIQGIVGKENVTVYNSKAEMEAAGLSDLDMNSDGFIEVDGKIIINREQAANAQAISVASHELLHKVLKSEFKNNPEMKRVVDEFKQILKNKGVFQQIETRAEMYRQEGIGDVDGADMDEYFTFFSDAISKNEIPFQALEESQWVKIGKAIANLFNTRFGTKNLKFNSGQQVFDFIKDYQAGIEKGKLTGQAKKKLKAGAEVEGTNKKSVSDAAKKSNAKLDAVPKDKVTGAVAQNTIATELPKMVKAQIAKRFNLPPSQLNEFTDDVIFKMYAGQETTKYDGRGTLSGFLGGRIKFRIEDVVREEYKRPQQERLYLGTVDNLQASDQKDLEGKKTAQQTVQKPEFVNLVESKVLPDEMAAKVKQKVVSTTRVLRSRIDAAVSLNRTVTPLIAEIKKEIGKQADIEFKKMLGAKKNNELRDNLLKLKKPILENLTTTFLMQAMPFAIQKQVDGRFTSDWQGQKIDRESVETDKAGRTSGAEIVRRIPNPVNNVSDQDFLGYMFKGEEVIRGRKEALAKALAEEYAFDLYNQELKNEDSEIRQAFEANQTRLGVELSENLAQEFSRQSERGNVKRSVSRLSKEDAIKWEAGKDKFFVDIKALLNSNGAIKENAIKKAHKNNYPDFTEAQHKAISKQFFRLLKPLKGIDVETSLKEEGKTFEEYLVDIAKDIDTNETIAKMTGVEGSIASLFENYNNVMDAQTAIEDVLKTLTIQEAVAFTSTSFANSGRIGLWVDGELDFSKTHRSDLYSGKEQVIEALNRAGFKIKSISNTEITLQDGTVLKREYSATGNVLKGHLTGKFDAEADKANANAAWKYTTAMIKGIKNSTPEVQAMVMASLNSGTNTALRAAAPVTYRSSVLPSQITKDYRYEHGVPARVVLAHLYQSIVNGDTSIDIKALKADYQVAIIPVEMDKVIGKSGYQQVMIAGYKPGETPWWKRYYNFATRGKIQYALESLEDGSIIGQQYADYFNQKGVKPEVKANAEAEVKKITTQQKAINNARKRSYTKNPKGISVYDFDDTLAFSKSQVIVIMPAEKSMLDIAARRLFGETALKNKPGFLKTFDSLNEEQQAKVLKDVPGATKRITPAEFAKKGEELTAQGAKFDFSEFNKVVEGTPGPLAPRLKKAIEKFGNKNIFVLTARPQESAVAIHAFLKGLGLEIPLENITGLANGAPAAKAAWMVTKVADGFNDFYFVDDHLGNVKAVKDILNTFDVKGKVQQARVKRSVTLSKELNDMVERNKGAKSEAIYSKIKARKDGAKKGRFKFFVPYGAEDFRGLTSYTLAGKGKQGEADQKFFEDNLVVPYMRGISAMEKARRALKNDFAMLLKMFPGMKKRLGKQIGDTDYTVDQAVRVYLWTQQGQEVPGISKRDQKKLNSLVANDPDLSAFADGLQTISKQEQWPTPAEYWAAGSVLKDINQINEVGTRSEYLQEFNNNVDIIFDENNLTKLEATYGTRYVNALKNSIARMKSGRNRPAQPGAYEQQWLNWVNNSVGTIMFFNRRSAAMQMLSFANFVNWSDNNPLKAGIAFANQPAYWSAWSKIFNSDKLKERRGGLKSDVQEQEIANQAKNSKDKASAVIAYLLKIGFTPTQIADSFAIATGGATFLINRTKTYKKQGLSKAEAEAKAFEDFSAISDETQQSGDPMLVSAQQSSHLGRLILAFQNTPMQYTRLMKKAGQDLINGRGDAKTNISKIVYYGFIQNLIFSALQNSLFAMLPGFDDEEEDDEQYEKTINTKTERIVNSMVDTILRGSGLTGAVVSTLKNVINRYYKEEKKGFTADHAYTLLELANVSPPIGSKMRKVYGAIQTKKFDKDVIAAQGWDVTLHGRFNISPNYEILASLSSAGLNLPLDRALAEIDGISEALDARNTSYQRLALGLGWRTWDVKANKEEEELVKAVAKIKRKKAGIEKAKATRAQKKKEEQGRVANMTEKEYNEYMDAKILKRREAARKAAETRRQNK